MPFTLVEAVATVIPTLAECREDADRNSIRIALEHTHGCIVDAARVLDVSRATLSRLLTQYGIRPAQVVTNFQPHAAKVARQWAKQVACEHCLKPMFHRGALARHRCSQLTLTAGGAK